MKYYSVPSDFKTQTIDGFYELNNRYPDHKIMETYGQVTSANLVNSGRVTEALPPVDFKALESFVRYSQDHGIDFNYTLNPACLGNYEFSLAGIREIHELLGRLNGIGIRSLTVALPSLIELVQASGYKFGIKASAICEINSPAKALFYKNLGAARIVVDVDITREFGKLRNISKVFGQGVEIIINSVCYRHCAYKLFHYNHDAHCIPQYSEQTIKDYFTNRCAMQRAGRPENPIRINWIRPEDLNYYTEAGIRYFKLQGRHNVLTGDIMKTLECYIKGDYDGNLFELIAMFAPYNSFQPFIDNKKLDGFIKKFAEQENFCTGVCGDCHYCEGFAKKAMDFEKIIMLNEQAMEFFSDYDEYSWSVKNLNSN